MKVMWFSFKICVFNTPMLKLFSSKTYQTHSLSFGKLIQTKHNGVLCSKIIPKSGTTVKYEILKEHIHPNIIPVFKTSQHSIYTKKINDFLPSYEKNKVEYNKYVVQKIKEALEFVHTILKKEHRAVKMDSLVLEDTGQVLLCNFDRICDFEDGEIDNEMLDTLSLEMTGKRADEIHGVSDIFNVIFKTDEAFLLNAKIEEKRELFDRILPNKDILPQITVKYLFNVFLKDAHRDQNKEYKAEVVDFLGSLDDKWFYDSVKNLFSILDSTIRNCILVKFMNQKFSTGDLDALASDLSLGLQVKDKTTKKLSIDFVFNHEFNIDAFNFLLDSMHTCTDSESMVLICDYLMAGDYSKSAKSLYNLLHKFLISEKNVLLVYKCIDKYCACFDKVKMTKEMLPILCSKLVDKENQEYCFALVEKILNLLRSHKDEIQGKDWTLKSIKNIFLKKTDHSNKFEERVSKFSKEEYDEWNDFEIE